MTLYVTFKMQIGGIQKTTLLDYPGKVASVIFLHGCNFRCGYCHNPELVIEKEKTSLYEKKVLSFLKKRSGIIEGVCITGGEPLLSLKKEFLQKIKDLGYKIKLDTNGSLPKQLQEIIQTKLIDYIAMDIKSSPKNYSKITGRNTPIQHIEQSIQIIHQSGIPYEFRTTVIPEIHDATEITLIGTWIQTLLETRAQIWYLQGFKNSGKYIDKTYHNKKDVSETHLRKLQHLAKKYFKQVEIRV